MAQTVRIDPSTHDSLRSVSKKLGVNLQEGLSRAVLSLERELMLAAMDADYAALREEPEAWAEEQRERALWDGTLSDGVTAE